MVKEPSALVCAAVLEPFTVTVTPFAGIPSFTFVTIPVIWVCAKAVTDIAAKHSIMQILRTCFKLIFIKCFGFVLVFIIVNRWPKVMVGNRRHCQK